MNFSIKTLLYFLCFGLSFSAFSQDPSDEIKAYADLYLDAIENQNYQKITNMTYGNIVALAGGSDLFISSLKESGTSAGTFDSHKVVHVSDHVNAGNELHAIVTYEVIMLIAKSKFQSTNNLLACSNDKGETWKFVNLDHFDLESLKVFVPLYNQELVIPDKREPTIIEE